MKTIWIDVETTGLNPDKDTIIELAALYEDQMFRVYCLPKKKTRNFKEIEELTGITWDFLKRNGISEKSMHEMFTGWMNRIINKYDKEDKAIFAGYNSNFDNTFVRRLFDKCGDKYFGSYFYKVNLDVKSTVALALRKGIIPVLENFKNETVANHFGINFNAHDALEDIQATKAIQEKLERELIAMV